MVAGLVVPKDGRRPAPVRTHEADQTLNIRGTTTARPVKVVQREAGRGNVSRGRGDAPTQSRPQARSAYAPLIAPPPAHTPILLPEWHRGLLACQASKRAESLRPPTRSCQRSVRRHERAARARRRILVASARWTRSGDQRSGSSGVNARAVHPGGVDRPARVLTSTDGKAPAACG